jgi:RES domain-containing protein
VTPLPPPLGHGPLTLWRLDQAKYSGTWDSGEGSHLAGGRWNARGTRVVYAALDPATAILEVAVHKTFRSLDIVPHVLTSAAIAASAAIFVVEPGDVPNANWLRPGIPSAGQQGFGDALLAVHQFVLLPSVVSQHSWIVVFSPVRAAGAYGPAIQEAFARDTRLHPPRS